MSDSELETEGDFIVRQCSALMDLVELLRKSNYRIIHNTNTPRDYFVASSDGEILFSLKEVSRATPRNGTYFID